MCVSLTTLCDRMDERTGAVVAGALALGMYFLRPIKISPHSLTHSLTLSHSLSLSHSVSLCLSLSRSLAPSLPLTLSLPRSLPPSLSYV